MTLFGTVLRAQSLTHKQGEMLVQFASDQNVRSFLKEFQLKHSHTALLTAKPLVKSLNIWQLDFDMSIHNEVQLKNDLWKEMAIEQVQFNHFVHSRSIPNDALFEDQWHHINTLVNGNPEADLDSDLAWDISTGGLTPQGDTIVLAIIDNGVNSSHPDLENRLWINHREIPDNGIDDDMNGYIDDHLGYNSTQENGNIEATSDHGTSVAGIIGAAGNNNIGVSGINWDSKLMIIKNDFNTTEANVLIAYGYVFTMRQQYNFSLGAEGAYVVASNASWGLDFGKEEDAPLWCSFYDELGKVGIVNCAATTNNPVNVDQEGDLPTSCSSRFLVSVTNVNQFGEKVANAGFGKNSIDIGAFGDGVFTTLGSGYGAFNGTSAASPMLTGLVGLLYAAPCENLSTISKNDPQAAASFVVDYLLNGAKASPSLSDITQTSGKVNMFNSITNMMNDCFDCTLPASIRESSVQQNEGTFSWTAFNSSLAVNLQYRKLGESILNTVINISPPFTLTGLEPCTSYEYQIESICGDTTSNYTGLQLFTTAGCCENPVSITAESLSQNQIFLEWESADAVPEYAMRFKRINEEFWIVLENSENAFVSIDGLDACSNYEFQVSALCGMGVDWTASFLFDTEGCGLCIEGNYCEISGQSTASEWIDQIRIHDEIIPSGNNDGFIFHDNLDLELTAGGDFSFELAPGYANQALPEKVSIWLDLNQNEVFEDEELMLESPIIRELYKTRLNIPSSARLGGRRMRIVQSWVEDEYNVLALSPCEDIAFGEVEDICVQIIAPTAPCANQIEDLELVSSDLSSAILSWSQSNDATEFKVYYKEFGAPEFSSFYTEQNITIINGLESCLRYEIQVAAICNGIVSAPSQSLFVDVECIPLSTNEDAKKETINVLSNPFTDEIVVQTESILNISSFQLYHLSGARMDLPQVQVDSDLLIFEGMSGYLPGVYILSMESENKTYVLKLLKI